MVLKLVLALDSNYGMGKSGKLAWHYPEEFKNFKKLTQGSTCVMGKNTFLEIEELSMNGKILSDRNVVVISKTLLKDSSYKNKYSNVVMAESYEDALAIASKFDREVCIIGGKSLYYKSIPDIKVAYVTIIHHKHDCDNFFEFNRFLERKNHIYTISSNDDFTVYKIDYTL